MIIEDGNLIDDSISWVTADEYSQWLTANGYTAEKSAEQTLMQAFIYINTLPFREPLIWRKLIKNPEYNEEVDDDEDRYIYIVRDAFKQAQMNLALLIDREDFDPTIPLDPGFLVEKGLGRNAIVKKWQERQALSGVSLLDIFKRFTSVYAFLQKFVVDGNVGNFELVR